MSDDRDRDDPAVSPPSRPGAGVAPRSRFQDGLRTAIALVVCGGILGWTVQTVLTDNHEVKDAIRAMNSWNASERVGAIQELEIAGLGNGKIAIPPLIAALGDKDARVRTAAAVALGPIGSDAASSGIDRENVAAALMALLGSLKDPEPSVRGAAANALMSLPVGGKPPFVDHRAVMAILVERLGDPDVPSRLAAVQIMAALGPWAEDDPPSELVGALRDEKASVRAMAAVTLGSFARNLDPVIPVLFRMMEEDQPPVRAACSAVLGRLSTPRNFSAAVVPYLIAAMGRPDRRVRSMACSMLGNLGPAALAAIPALIRIAREKRSMDAGSDPSNWSTDLAAIEAMGRIATGTEAAARVVPILTERIRDDAPDTWRAAVNALSWLGPAAAPAVPELIRALPRSIVMDPKFPSPTAVTMALGRIAPGTPSAGAAVSALMGLLRTDSSEVRRAAADALGLFGPAGEPAIPDLVRILQESRADTTEVAHSVAQAIGRIAPGTPSSDAAVAVLIDALRSKSRSTRMAAASTLAAFGAGAAAAIPHLRALLKESGQKGVSDQRSIQEEEWVRSGAQASLDRLLEAVEGRK